jgi:TPR repeat protein
MISRFFSVPLLVLFCAAIGMQGCSPTGTNTPYAMPTPADHQMMEELDAMYDLDKITMNDVDEIIRRVLHPFSCTQEKNILPQLDSEIDQLYQYALWLEAKYERDAKNASTGISGGHGEPNHAEFQKAVWLYRIAAASGHWKASKQLAEMLISIQWGNSYLSNEWGSSYNSYAQWYSGIPTVEEVAGTTSSEIAEDLIQRNIPYGYYLKGVLLDNERDKQGAALWYLRRAADMGNPDAQFGFMNKLKEFLGIGLLRAARNDRNEELPKDNSEAAKWDKTAKQILSCAAKQGNKGATKALGKTPKNDESIQYIIPPPLPDEQRIAEIARGKGIEPAFEPKLSTGQLLQLPFTCANEKDHTPQPDPEADMLYRHANAFLEDVSIETACNCDARAARRLDPQARRLYPQAERLYRIAGAWGHKKALQYFVTELGCAHSQGNVPLSLYLIDVSEKLVQREIPYGYFAMGRVLERGEFQAWKQRSRSVRCDQDDKCEAQDEDDEREAYAKRQDEALRYFRKGADLGSPEAQFRLHKEVRSGSEMLSCAKKQGYDGVVYYVSRDAQETTPTQMPSEERIREMACAQGLDPQTGLPTNSTASECMKRP